MKTVAIVCFLAEEIDNIKSQMEIISAKNIVGTDFIMGKMFGNNVVLVKPYIGKVNSAICTQILIDLYAVDCIIGVSAATSLSNELAFSDIVISDDVCYYDFDMSFYGLRKGDIYEMDESFFKADADLIGISSKAVEKSGKNVNIGRVVTGDRIVSSDEKSEIRSEFKALCADMGSAAIAHTCYLNKIPFVIICLLYEKLPESILNGVGIFSSTELNFATQSVEKIIDMIE